MTQPLTIKRTPQQLRRSGIWPKVGENFPCFESTVTGVLLVDRVVFHRSDYVLIQGWP